jgi:hypothetical protein
MRLTSIYLDLPVKEARLGRKAAIKERLTASNLRKTVFALGMTQAMLASSVAAPECFLSHSRFFHRYYPGICNGRAWARLCGDR